MPASPSLPSELTQIFCPSLSWWDLALRAAVVFAAVLLLLRLGGKRQIGQMGIAEFVALLLISNAVQNSMNGGDNSITGGLILACVLILASWAVAWSTYRWRGVERLVQGRPTLLIHQGKILHDNLRKELLHPHELLVILRRQGIHSLCEVQEAVLESDGYVTIFKKGEEPGVFAQPPMQ